MILLKFFFIYIFEKKIDPSLEMTAGGADTVRLLCGEGRQGVEEGRIGEKESVGREANHCHRHQHLFSSLLITRYSSHQTEDGLAHWQGLNLITSPQRKSKQKCNE